MSVDVISPSFSFRSPRKRQKVGGSPNFRTPLALSSCHNYFEQIPATPFNTTQYLMNLHLRSPLPTVFVVSADKDNPNVELSEPLEQYGSMMETFSKSDPSQLYSATAATTTTTIQP